MLGRKVEHRLMGRIAQECPPLHASQEGLGDERNLTPLGYEPADLETPVGIAIIDHPIVALHIGQLVDDMGQMEGPISAGAGWPQIPYEVSCWDDERGEQGAHTMTDVLVLAFFRLARLDRLGRIGTLQNLPARLCVGTDDQAPLVVKAERIAIELTDITCLGLEGRIVAVEPIHAPMGMEVCRLEDTPDTGATHRPRPLLLLEGCDQIIEAPPGGGTMHIGRFPGRHRQHVDPLRGGKSAAGDPSVVHPAGP